MKNLCKNCQRKIGKRKVFCNNSCSATYNNKRRILDITSNAETKKLPCSLCIKSMVVVNKRANPSKVKCLSCKKKLKCKICFRCKKSRLNVKYNRGTTCKKCFKRWTQFNSIFSKIDPDWNRTNVCGGYKVVFCPGHPRAFGLGYVHIHVIKAEIKIGRFLKRGEAVHHVDGDKFNNKKGNLKVLSVQEHSSLHASVKPTQFVTAKCAYCRRTVKRRKGAESSLKGYTNTFCDRKCFYAHLRK